MCQLPPKTKYGSSQGADRFHVGKCSVQIDGSTLRSLRTVREYSELKYRLGRCERKPSRQATHIIISKGSTPNDLFAIIGQWKRNPKTICESI